MGCSSGTNSVTGQQRVPPQPAVPLLFAEGPAALSPTGTMAGACLSTSCSGAQSWGGSKTCDADPTPHCWLP